MASLSSLPLFDIGLFAMNTATQAITSSNTKAGLVFTAPKTGNIRFIGTKFSAFSGAGTVDLRLETVSSRLPSGTLKGTGTNVNYTPASTSNFVWSQLGTDAAVTAGDLLAVAIVYVSGTSATVVWCNSSNMVTHELPYVVLATAGTYSVQNNCPPMAIKYDDGTILRGCVPSSLCANTTFQSGTNPNERATVFTPPFNCTLVGAKWYGSLGTNAAYTANLYSGTSTSPVANGTITVVANAYANGNNGLWTLQFPVSLSLTANQQYRLSIKATAAANITIGKATFISTAERNVCFGEMTSDTRNGGAWIGEVTTQMETICPLIDSVSVTAGSGGMSRSRVV